MTESPSPDKGRRRPGRPPKGTSDARESVARAALEVFLREGYEPASLRAVAREAGVDPSLVHHYFASKMDLLMAAVRLPLEPNVNLARILVGDPERLGYRLVQQVLRIWDSPVGPLLVQVLTSRPEVLRLLESYLRSEVVTAVFAQLGVPADETPQRVTALGSVVGGLVLSRHVLRVSPMVDLAADQVVRTIGPMVQYALTGPVPGTRAAARTVREARIPQA